MASLSSTISPSSTSKRADHELRGARPLASSRTRHGPAARIHSGRGRNRSHRLLGRMGAPPGLRGSGKLAGTHHRRRERLTRAVQSRNLVPTVVNALATSGLSPDRLELEITELVLLEENEATTAILRQFHDLGSGSRWMISAPAIRRSAICAASRSTRSRSINPSFAICPQGGQRCDRPCRGRNEQQLGITTTAEGVETKEQLASLTSEGCDEFQGFLFSEPRSAADVARIIATQAPRTAAVA